MKKEIEKSVSSRINDKISRLQLTSVQKKTFFEILPEPIAYIPDDRFSRRTVMQPIMDHNVVVMPNTTIGAEDEQILFLQMNFARHKMCQQRRRLFRRGKWLRKDVFALLEWYQKQLEYRSKIVTSNMGLVLSMVQRVEYPGVEFTDLISEGSMALLRATEKFDCSRGFKFSTYACRAIFKGFLRAAKQNYRYRRLFPIQLENTLEIRRPQEQYLERDEAHEDMVDEIHTIIRDNLAELSDIEMKVMRMRFSLNDTQPSPMTLKQVGQQLGLTKERIRQIQNKALEKLRTVARERQIFT